MGACLLARMYVCTRLCYDKKGVVRSCGFASVEDATVTDLQLWTPQITDAAMEVDTAKYIVSHVGSGFCELIEQEKSAMAWLKPAGLSPFSPLSFYRVLFAFSASALVYGCQERVGVW